MRDNGTLMNDMLRLGENALGNLLGARHEFGAQARERLGGMARKLDLVSRSEFDAAFAMLAKARAMQEELAGRLEAVEAKLGLTPAPRKIKKTKTSPKAGLRSVKQGKRGKKRGA
jgi:BMFP domain-containing protein YqiC